VEGRLEGDIPIRCEGGLRGGNPIRTIFRHTGLRSTIFAAVLLSIVILPLGGGIASSPAATGKAPGAGRLTARLAATRLAPVQASEIRLNYRFRHPSTSFSYQLQRKQGKRWAPLRAVKLKGHFKGVHATTVKRLFGRRAIRAGSYRLRLRSDRNLVSLRFSIFAAKPVTGVTSVSAGGTLTCILVRGGRVKCWGYNYDGELGNSTMANSSTPVSVGGVHGAIAVNSGYKHTCVRFPTGTISCWGYNRVGELGNGTLTNSSFPVAVSRLSGVVTNSSGLAHNCAVLTNGTVSCWGDNETGELGLGTLNRRAPYGISSPGQVNGVSGAIGVSAGFLHTCVLITGGSIECWGYNNDGEVGNGTVTPARPHAVLSPVSVTGITKALSVSSGSFHTCALIAGGSIECWGHISTSYFAPTPLLDSTVPRQVPGITSAISISTGGFHTCALIAGGTVKCWGTDQFGQLGDGKLQDSARPVTVIGIKHAVSISSGVLHSCALLAGGTVKCWGGNDEGELGTGTLTASPLPISVVQPKS
jgi:alpha-tubulin suppressor-like RCC1 family protein